MKSFASIEEFYADDEQRRHSPESDYGVWWRDSSGTWLAANWRVSWVEATGEVYGLRSGSTKVSGVLIGGRVMSTISIGDGLEGPLVVFGVIPASHGECIQQFCSSWHVEDCPASPSYGVDQVLEGWAEMCGQSGSLEWVKSRLERAEVSDA